MRPAGDPKMSADTATEREPREPIRVLMVEDMEIEAEFSSRQLHTEGIVHVMQRVETEEQMRAAIENFQPTLILSDFSLPRFDGLSALEIARECAPDVPFVFVSGTIGEERAIEALRRGAVDYVLKNNLKRLVPAIRRALEEADAKAVRRRQEQQIARLNAVLRMLSGINSAVVRIRDREALLDEACRLAVKIGGYGAAVVALRHPRRRTLEASAWSGVNEDAARRLVTVVAQMTSKKAAATDRAAETITRFIYSEGRASARSSRPSRASSSATSPASKEPSKGRAVFGLPLLVDKTRIGVLVIAAQSDETLGDEELRMLREVAANLSFAVQYLRKYTKARYFDLLTGLAKRGLFCDRVARWLQSREANAPCAIAVVDVENLGAINDAFGRHSGDLLLQLVADRLKRGFHDTELLAHLSGGTFAVVQPLTEAPTVSVPRLHAEIDALFAATFRLHGKDVLIAARSGVALFPEDGTDPDALAQKAEATLRTAKLARERHRQYSAAAHSAVIARVALEQKLRAALEQEQFELHYQPKVSVTSRRILGVEALLRWKDPSAGLVSPGEFLPVLEASGLIVDVGDWVIQRAARDCRRWRDMGLSPVRIAVNISPTQLRASEFVGRFLERTQEWATQSCGLDIEITEGALVDEYSGEVSKLKMLRTSGVNIAIDDFGTGYSSLGRLSHLPIDTLKIDRGFVSQMVADARARQLVSSMISIARAFKMTVVAEGVESQDELDALAQLGCDQSQGFLHCRPVRAEDLMELLQHGKSRYLLPAEIDPAQEQPQENAG
jgi:diguanylate cyclase (GGDEF)-like protein